jgi:hypothetical protein
MNRQSNAIISGRAAGVAMLWPSVKRISVISSGLASGGIACCQRGFARKNRTRAENILNRCSDNAWHVLAASKRGADARQSELICLPNS